MMRMQVQTVLLIGHDVAHLTGGLSSGALCLYTAISWQPHHSTYKHSMLTHLEWRPICRMLGLPGAMSVSASAPWAADQLMSASASVDLNQGTCVYGNV